MPKGGVEPQGAKHRRILSTQAGSDPFGKIFYSIPFFNQLQDECLIRYDLKCSVLNIELLQFYYSRKEALLPSGTLLPAFQDL